MACKLAKCGYYGGSPEAVLQAPADMVLALLHFEKFENDLEVLRIQETQEKK